MHLGLALMSACKLSIQLFSANQQASALSICILLVLSPSRSCINSSRSFIILIFVLLERARSRLKCLTLGENPWICWILALARYHLILAQPKKHEHLLVFDDHWSCDLVHILVLQVLMAILALKHPTVIVNSLWIDAGSLQGVIPFTQIGFAFCARFFLRFDTMALGKESGHNMAERGLVLRF